MFNPSEHLLNIGSSNKPRMYLENKWRLVWLRETCPDATIETSILHLDLDREVTAEVSEWDEVQRKNVKVVKHGKGLVIFHAVVTLPTGASATGTKMENAAAFPDFLEKAETGSVSRALAALGFGTQFCDDLDEGDRLADAPVTRPSRPDVDWNAPATMQQLDTIKKLQRAQGLSETDLDGITWGDAAEMLKSLQKRRA